MRSTDNGSSFDNATSPTGKNLDGVTFGNNTFVAVGASVNILRSTDNGSSFDNVTSPTANHLSGVTFGNNTFVAVGDDGTIVRSTDNGTTWDNATSPNTKDFRGIGFGNNTFVAVGSGNTIIISTDNGSSFNTVTNPTTKNLWGVVFSFSNSTSLRLNIDFGAAKTDVPSSYAGAANQSGTWNKISSNSTNNLVDIDNVSTSISLEVTAGSLGGSYGGGSGADLIKDNFFSSNGASWKVEITGISNGIYDIYYYAPNHSAVSTGSFYINSALQNSIPGSGNNELSQGTDWGMLSGVTVSNSTLTLESYSTSSYRGLAGLQIRPTQ